jgi:hypothetical protein
MARVAPHNEAEQANNGEEEDKGNQGYNCLPFCGAFTRRPSPADRPPTPAPMLEYTAAQPLVDTTSGSIREFKSILRRSEKCTVVEICDSEIHLWWNSSPLLQTDVLHVTRMQSPRDTGLRTRYAFAWNYPTA